ncbi:PaaI family thioesterase [Streptomyces halstedii]|uniref:PaaI family thioesterase n=1 Tax=Streptomyces TaxID=1883 RepID=UPI00049010C0|nr:MULTISPECIES: PaaI family thioesterase [Streptomyces]MYR72165.1 PaaI family thioesterase [Streptomyces sp. SID4925]MYY16471.1 PaaI family thioesterase [Streptomyces sp. SID4912]SBU99058.1 Acyl-coenzyme A thioesterase PaaI, contains HGG motif [Streptomyces sp. OspMP-M45]SCD84406.1 Acyl-coenzyme A thioesterase PaaI, contains HGG motif [Streptomyces sp. DpondAA-D4]SCE24777.1 Acyl-coenzyme A thioesterase PaaI, contains HGG motif [Streptomyces sp. PpalLS-921]
MTVPAPENTPAPAGPRLVAEEHKDGVDAAVAAARRLVTALLRAGDGTGADLDAVAAQLDAVAVRLTEGAPPVSERLAEMWRGEGVTRHDPVTGPENALAPPLRLYGTEEGAVEGVVTLDLPYQGPPGHVHGGVSALLLDHTLGVANHWAGTSGMTAELTLRYLRPTPLFEPLTVTGRQVSVDGSRIRTAGEIRAGDRVCVTAAGLFINKQLPRPS